MRRSTHADVDDDAARSPPGRRRCCGRPGTGGPDGLLRRVERCERSLAAITAWVARSEWAGFLAERPEIRSPTSVCLSIVDQAFTGLDEAGQQAFVKEMCGLLAEHRVAYDIQSYRDAPAGLRIC